MIGQTVDSSLYSSYTLKSLLGPSEGHKIDPLSIKGSNDSVLKF